MRYARAAAYVLTVSVAVVLLAPGLSPIRLSYVTSDSMEPGIMQGDGYVIYESGDVAIGDVVTFRSAERGGFVTHRVVDETSAGYVTKGDNNPSTDQAAGMDHVTEDRIVGTVVSLGAAPLTIPGLGGVAAWLDRNGAGALAAVVVLLAASLLVGTGGGSVVRDVVYVDDIVVPLFLGVVLVSAALMIFGTANEELQYVATEGGSPAPHTLTVGEPTTQRVDAEIVASPVTTAVIDLDGVELVNATREGDRRRLWVTVPPQDEPGVYTASVAVHPYPAVMPQRWLEALHGVHPIAAMASAIGLVFAPLALLYALFFDGRARIRAPRSRWLRRWLEALR